MVSLPRRRRPEQRAADWMPSTATTYGPPWLGDEFIVNNNPRARTVTFPFARSRRGGVDAVAADAGDT